jgi:hypothetical protein
MFCCLKTKQVLHILRHLSVQFLRFLRGDGLKKIFKIFKGKQAKPEIVRQQKIKLKPEL